MNASRDPLKCGRVIIARAQTADMGEFKLPHNCPQPIFPPDYSVRSLPRGIDVLTGPYGILAVFVQPIPAATQPVRIVTRRPDDCPKAPPGYRVIHALVKEN